MLTLLKARLSGTESEESCGGRYRYTSIARYIVQVFAGEARSPRALTLGSSLKRVSARKYTIADTQKSFQERCSIIENMELQAAALGLVSCGINTTVVAMRNKPEVRKAAGIPEGYDALASVIIGYAEKEAPERTVKPEFIPVSFVK
ncbi:MAG: nitroreductase family protein [Synergistaceae bacterium]|nr:nitroreductase family protein [Synergistaceae bacterium]